MPLLRLITFWIAFLFALGAFLDAAQAGEWPQFPTSKPRPPAARAPSVDTPRTDLGLCVFVGIVEGPGGQLFEQNVCTSGAIVLVPTTCAHPALEGDPRHCKES